MRLTLRTLLAYLEDELKPSESKEIGQKIAASPVATSLAQRIREVMRRRRLSAEDLNESGLDANIVAEYLDGSLSAQEVADVEKVCLGSDAHLAEVAACHQILTLVLGEPVDISEASRERMYALADDGTAGKFEGPSAPREQTVAAAPEPTPFPAHLMRKPWWKKALPILVPAVLIGVWVVIIVFFAPSLNPFAAPGDGGSGKVQIAAVDEDSEDSDGIPVVVPDQGQEPEVTTVPEGPEGPQTNINPEPPPDMPEEDDRTTKPSAVVAETDDDEGTTPSTPTEVKPEDSATETDTTPAQETDSEPPAVQQKVVGRYQSSEGVMLTYDPAKNGWFTVPYELKLLSNSQLIVPEPFSAVVEMEGNAPLVTVDQATHVEFITDSPAAPEGIKIYEGRVLLEGVDAQTTPFAIQADQLNWRVELIGANSRVGVELQLLPVVGFEHPLPANHFQLRVLVAQGAARVANSEGQSVMINENQQVILHNPLAPEQAPADPSAPPPPQPEPGQLSDQLLQPIGLLPDWLRQPQQPLSLIQKRYQKDFAAQFDPVLGASENMDPLIEDDRPQMAEYAVSCLGVIGDYRGLIHTLHVSEFEACRLKAGNALRKWLPRHPEERPDYLVRLELAFPTDDDAEVLDRLLWGFTSEEARDSGLSQQLISWLDHSQPAIRELAFLEIARLTGMEQGYRALVSPTHRRTTIQRWKNRVEEEGSLLPTADDVTLP
jgi:hypothetical protein